MIYQALHFFLENQILEMKPALKKGDLEKKLMNKIADGNVELSKKAQGERKLRMMKSAISPSELAKKILLDFAESEKQEQKKEKENKSKDVDS